MRKQGPSKTPSHLGDRLLDEKIQAGEVREMNENVHMNSRFVRPVIFLPRRDYVKIVLDARYLNSSTETTNCIWLLEAQQFQMIKIDGSNITSSDLFCAYSQVPLTDDAQKVPSFSLEVDTLFGNLDLNV